MLGDLLAAARRSTGAFEGWLLAEDPALAEQLASAAALMGISGGAYARMAVADFSRLASEEDWASLVSALRDSSDPGSLCLMAMVDWRLTAASCEAHHPKSVPDAQGGGADAVRRTAD
jgi:hypothetical protein